VASKKIMNKSILFKAISSVESLDVFNIKKAFSPKKKRKIRKTFARANALTYKPIWLGVGMLYSQYTRSRPCTLSARSKNSIELSMIVCVIASTISGISMNPIITIAQDTLF
jgi:hypothetical protein